VTLLRRFIPEELAESLSLVAPGTGFREAIDNIIRANNGGLIVVANPAKLEKLGIMSGGIEIDCDFAPMRLYELAKMDGALIVSPGLSVVHYANVHLNPDPSLASDETGMRHLAAHRTARQSGELVVAVSERRGVVSLYKGPYGPYVLEEISVVLSKANSALATLEKFTSRLREEVRMLTMHEYEGAVSLREVAGAISTFEYSARIAQEIRNYVRELGREGRLIQMQLEQAFRNVPEEYEALIRDYISEGVDYQQVREQIREFSADEISDPSEVVRLMGYEPVERPEEIFLKPRGYRQLVRVPRLPGKVAERLVGEFGSLQGLMEASEEELDGVEGVGQARARAIHRSLRRQRNVDPYEESV